MRRTKQKALDPTLERIARESADECGIKHSQMREAYYISMELFLKKIRGNTPVLLPNMGYFFLSPYKTGRLILRMFGSMRNRISGKDPEGMTREDVQNKLKKYWPLHQIAITHYVRNGNKYRAKKKFELLRAAGNSKELQPIFPSGAAERAERAESLSEGIKYFQS